MRQLKIFAAVAVLMVSVSGASAQKAIKDGSGRFIIDSRNAVAGGITTTAKARTTTGTNSTSAGTTLSDIASVASNAQVYHYFEVHPTDNSTSSQWLNAVTLCQGLATGGGNWRLPTQRELMAIWICHERLKTLSGFTALSAYYYWSATEPNASNSWYVSFINGATNNYAKTDSNRVRCVRDVTP